MEDGEMKQFLKRKLKGGDVSAKKGQRGHGNSGAWTPAEQSGDQGSGCKATPTISNLCKNYLKDASAKDRNNSGSQHLATLTGHQGPVWQISWAHPKFGSLLASCSYDGRVIVWREGNPNEWTQVHVFEEHISSVNSVAWAPHELGLCLACGSSDGNISVFTARQDGGWDTSRIDQAHPVGVTSVSWAPSTAPGALVGSGMMEPVQKLCSGGCDNTVKVWKLYNGVWKLDCFPALQMHTDWVRDVAWAPNLGLPKSTIASASQDGRVIIWTVAKEGDQWQGKVLYDFRTPVWRVSWSLTGNILAVADGNNNVTLWNEAVDGEWIQVSTVEP
ncbi:hypothetical protein NL676_029660 [Syzygium grande]|nr:hypothetical protein NL676_029660 [Syzygium grande]